MTTTALTEVVIDEPAWQALDLPALAERAFAATLRALDLPARGWEIAVLACDDARIAALNAKFRGRPRPTNVLSWPALPLVPAAPGLAPPAPPAPNGPMPIALGDIAIAWQTCTAEAAAQGKEPADHVTHLLVHGLLHLLGYDHVDDRDAALMEGLETRILANLGITDPY